MSSSHPNKALFSGLAGFLFVALLLGGVSLSLSSSETEEDLSDNETCLDCHIDEEHIGLLELDTKQVHNPEDGSLKEEAHTEVACIDCHMDIEEIPHKEDIERTVNCTDCHESPPE
ncbi:MAG: hypothetical protein R3330_16600 [Saprospiraceae bacterium]|nr:hypothetical protein [Saprospiraceae bacterium]